MLDEFVVFFKFAFDLVCEVVGRVNFSGWICCEEGGAVVLYVHNGIVHRLWFLWVSVFFLSLNGVDAW